MDIKSLAGIIAKKLSIGEQSVENTLALLDEGCTIPFISRYRKERTHNLDEVQITAISEAYDKLKEISKRKETIIKTITDLGKISDELSARINGCWEANELEDIYMPFKPKRRTKSQVARELGLEPLSAIIMLQRENDPERAARLSQRQSCGHGDSYKGCAGHHSRNGERGCPKPSAGETGFQT